MSNKRAVMFSFMTFLLLAPLLVITGVYLESNKTQNTHANRYLYASRIRYMEDDMATDIKEYLGFSVNVTRDQNRSSISIEDLKMNNQSITLSPYTYFVQNTFGNVINNQMNITDLSTYKINNAELRLDNKTAVLDNLSDIYAIEIELKSLSPTVFNNSQAPLDQGMGSRVRVTMLDYDSDVVLDEDLNLVLEQPHTNFSANNGNEYISVSLSDNIMKVTSSGNLSMDIKITYADNRNIKLSVAKLTIQERVNIKKTCPILLARG